MHPVPPLLMVVVRVAAWFSTALLMAAGAVMAGIIVSLAWEGVNLLNVGLHSYGFTSGAAIKLFSYIGGEILFLLVIWGLTAVRKRKTVIG